jgi:Tfp pilus assembly protein PilX
MKSLRKFGKLNQRGIVLAGSLMILAALTVAGVAARLMLRNDHRTVANLRHGSQAFYLAVSGIEWGKRQLIASPGLTVVPSDQSVSFNNGTFSVSFSSALSVGPLSAKVTVHSIGVVKSDSNALQAGLTNRYELSDSAIGMRGNIRAVNFSGTAVALSGVDHDPASSQPTGVSAFRPAISTDSQPTGDLLRAQTASLPSGSLQSDSGGSPIVMSGYLTAATLAQLTDQLCAAPGAVTASIPSPGTLNLANQSWGTRTIPQLRCVDGISGATDSVTLSGDSGGVGILIVRNAAMILSGTFRWEGLIVLSGSEVSLQTIASSNTVIYGSVVVSETGNPGVEVRALDVQGAFKTAFSRTALNRAAGLISGSTLNALYTSLPASLTQDYWRSVTP